MSRTSAQHDVHYVYGITVDEETAERIVKDMYRWAELQAENKELKRKVEVLLSDLDGEKQAVKALREKPVKYREENKKLRESVQELRDGRKTLAMNAYYEGWLTGNNSDWYTPTSEWHGSDTKSTFDSEEKE